MSAVSVCPSKYGEILFIHRAPDPDSCPAGALTCALSAMIESGEL